MLFLRHGGLSAWLRRDKRGVVVQKERRKVINEQLDQLEALANAATPGPWEFVEATEVGDTPKSQNALVQAGEDVIVSGNGASGYEGIGMTEADMRFVVAANPSAVLALVEEVRRLREYEALYKLVQAYNTGSTRDMAPALQAFKESLQGQKPLPYKKDE